MAGILSVQKIQGLATATDPTTVQISSGHVLKQPGLAVQTLYSYFSGQVTTSNRADSPVDTGLSVTITPKFADSKLLITANMDLYNGTNSASTDLWLYRDGSAVSEAPLNNTATGNNATTSLGRYAYAQGYNTGGASIVGYTQQFWISANNTSATTFKIYFNAFSAGTAYINVNTSQGPFSSMVVQEIAQ